MSWYGYNPNAVTTSQNADGSLTLYGNANNPGLGNMISSMSADGKGIAFGGGGYFEATLAVTGTNVNTPNSLQGGGGWPSWWANTYEALTGQNTMLGQVETDFMEMFAGNAYGGALHDWYNQDGSQVATNSPPFTFPAGTDVTQPHKYGFLWVPATASSQGYADFYFDGQVISPMHTSWNQYQAGQTAQQNPYAILDIQHQVLFFGTGQNNSITVYGAEVWQKSAANDISTLPPVTVPDPQPIPPGNPGLPPSANGTVVLAGSGNVIVDASGNSWTIVNGQVAVNGSVDAVTRSVIELAYVNGNVWQEIAGGLWWSKTLPTDNWGPSAGTTVSPLSAVPPSTPSANNTVVMAGSTDAITDAHGNIWTIVNGQVAVNGGVDTVTRSVIELAYVNGQVWQEITGGLWWSKSLPTDNWGPSAGTTVSPLSTVPPPTPSANDTVVMAGSTDAITDAHGNTWTIVNGQVAVNGTVDTVTRSVIELAYVNGQVWQEITGGVWWSKALPTDNWVPSAGTTVSPLPGTPTQPAGGTSAPVASYSGNGTDLMGRQPQSVTIQVGSYGNVSYTSTLMNAAWNTIKTVQATPATWDQSYSNNLAYDNFVVANLDLHAAGTANLNVLAIGEKRGSVTLGDGKDTFTWVASSNGGSAASNTMVINTGGGDDTIVLTAVGLSTFDDSHNTANGSLWNPGYQGNNSIAEVHLGAGNDTVMASGAVQSFIYGGSGNATVSCGTGADTIMVGAGGGDFTGGGGADVFVISQASGHAMIEDFIPGLSKLDCKGILNSAISSTAATENGVAGLQVVYDGSGHSVFLAHINAISSSDMIFS